MTSQLHDVRLLESAPHRFSDRADALIERGGRLRRRSGPRIVLARAVLTQLLQRMATDELRVVDVDGTATTYGCRGPGSYRASIVVTDERAWGAIATEGSIGLGRGFIEGWWTSDDPTTVVRILIRNLTGLDEIRNRLARVGGGLGDGLRRAIPRPGRDRDRDRDHIAAHYDLGNDFFALFLDETMTYSSAVFPHPTTSLLDASHTKYDRLLAKLGVDAAHRVLEIGSGWGGFAIRAAESTGCDVTTTTVSTEQHREATARVTANGLDDRIDVIGRDWRDLDGRYDRIVSIEMIEAVEWRDYDRFFATLDRCLEPDGLIGLQAICVPDQRYERAKNTEDFIRRFVFPGGQLPSLGAIGRAVSGATRLQIVDVEDLAAHYAETLRLWRDRFDARLEDVAALGLDHRFQRLWRFYLAYCEAAFLERHCTVNQIVLAGPDWRPDGLTLRPL
jgi:cyclopropane-fatty-acyl-phospholipid synthase